MLHVEKLFQQPNNSIGFVPIKMDDAHLYDVWFNDEKVRRNLNPKTPRTKDEIEGFITQITTDKNTKYFIINVDNKPIGHAGIKNIDEQNKTAELSCVIGEVESLGSGIGISSMILFAKKVFEEYDLDSIYIFRKKGISVGNLFTKIGFIKDEGEIKMDKYVLGREKFDEILGRAEEEN